jgi:hypothetical protein
VPHIPDILLLAGAGALAVVFVIVVRLRHRSHAEHTVGLAQAEVCEHLRPALELLLSRGHRVTRVGQRGPEMPLEIHLDPAFDPKPLYDELKLAEPVFLSERNVLYCKEDWCELDPQA